MQTTSENSIPQISPPRISTGQISDPKEILATAKLDRKVWTRWEHGNSPVLVWHPEGDARPTYELKGEEGSKFYPSARRLLQTVLGRERVPSFDSYFRIPGTSDARPVPNLLALLDQNSNRILVDGEISEIGTLRESEIVTDGSQGGILRAKPRDSRPEILIRDENRHGVEFSPEVLGLLEELKWPSFEREGLGTSDLRELVEEIHEGLTPTVPVLGIDLANRGHEVRKLLYAGFWGKMASQSYDPEEVLQEVFKGILVRNRGTCPWDARKAKFGYYVHMVISCVLTNYHRKQGRRIDRHVEELSEEYPGAASGGTDLMLGDEMAADSLDQWLAMPEHGGSSPDGMISRQILPMVRAGMQRREIVGRTGMKEATVSRALAHLRRWTRLWAEQVGVRVPVRTSKTVRDLKTS